MSVPSEALADVLCPPPRSRPFARVLAVCVNIAISCYLASFVCRHTHRTPFVPAYDDHLPQRAKEGRPKKRRYSRVARSTGVLTLRMAAIAADASRDWGRPNIVHCKYNGVSQITNEKWGSAFAWNFRWEGEREERLSET